MKKGIVLCFMVFFLNGLVAQNQSKEAVTAPSTDLGHENTSAIEAAYIDSVTVGGGTLMSGASAGNMVMPYYVEPDPYLNPGYQGTYDNSTLLSHWDWTLVGAPADVVKHAAVYSDLGITTDTLNQVFLEFGSTLGLFSLQVAESVPVIGCTSDTRELQIQVIDVPAATNASSNYAFCNAQATIENPKFTLTGYPPFYLNVQRVIQATNSDGSTASIETVTLDSEYDTGIAATYTMTQTGANTYEVELTDEPLESNGGRITTITYTLQGINDRISRKSDRMDASNHLYYEAAGSFVFTAYPVPGTGNIRSVSNN